MRGRSRARDVKDSQTLSMHASVSAPRGPCQVVCQGHGNHAGTRSPPGCRGAGVRRSLRTRQAGGRAESGARAGRYTLAGVATPSRPAARPPARRSSPRSPPQSVGRGATVTISISAASGPASEAPVQLSRERPPPPDRANLGRGRSTRPRFRNLLTQDLVFVGRLTNHTEDSVRAFLCNSPRLAAALLAKAPFAQAPDPWLFVGPIPWSGNHRDLGRES
jgi:hypothetical protein